MTEHETPRDDSQELLEFVGDITDYWSFTQVRDWVLLHPELTRTALHLYLLLRSMVSESARRNGGALRRMSLDQLCWLLPGVNGKPASPTMVKDALRLLASHDLVVNPDGGHLVTSTGKGGIQNTFRKYKVNDLPPDAFVGWRNVWDKLDAYTPDWRKTPPAAPLHTRTDEGVQQTQNIEGRISDPRSDLPEPKPSSKTPGHFGGRKSDSAGRISDLPGRKNGARKPVTRENEPLKEVFQTRLSLSSSPSPVPPDGDGVQTEARETAAPEDNPVVPEVPAPRSSKTSKDEQQSLLLAMLCDLPGRMHHDDALDLLPLAAQAVDAGWPVQQLREHLARRCDPARVFDVTAVYRKHLKRLPDCPAGSAVHPAAAAPTCTACNGSGLAEDPETFLPIGPCECRTSRPLSSAV